MHFFSIYREVVIVVIMNNKDTQPWFKIVIPHEHILNRVHVRVRDKTDFVSPRGVICFENAPHDYTEIKAIASRMVDRMYASIKT